MQKSKIFTLKKALRPNYLKRIQEVHARRQETAGFHKQGTPLEPIPEEEISTQLKFNPS